MPNSCLLHFFNWYYNNMKLSHFNSPEICHKLGFYCGLIINCNHRKNFTPDEEKHFDPARGPIFLLICKFPRSFLEGGF